VTTARVHRRFNDPRRLRGRAAATVLLVLATACTGPEAPLVVGMNDRTIDIVLGERVRVVTEVIPPALPIAITIPRTVPVAAPPIPVGPGPQPSPPTRRFELPPCTPPAEVEIAEEHSAISAPKAPPAEAAYEYFTVAVVLFVDPEDADGIPSIPPESEDIPLDASGLPVITTRTIADVAEEPAVGGLEPFTFDVVWEAGERTTTSAYRIVVGEPTVSPPEPGGDDFLPPETRPVEDRIDGVDPGPLRPGLYLTQSDRNSMDGFAPPAPGMKLVEFPVEGGASFAATATDGVTTIDYTSTVAFSPVVLDACDTWVEGWPVTIEGTVASNDPEYLGHQLARFEAEYVIAPQFGGLILEERVMVTTPSDGQSVPVIPVRISMAKIQTPPQPAGGDAG